MSISGIPYSKNELKIMLIMWLNNFSICHQKISYVIVICVLFINLKIDLTKIFNIFRSDISEDGAGVYRGLGPRTGLYLILLSMRRK